MATRDRQWRKPTSPALVATGFRGFWSEYGEDLESARPAARLLAVGTFPGEALDSFYQGYASTYHRRSFVHRYCRELLRRLRALARGAVLVSFPLPAPALVNPGKHSVLGGSLKAMGALYFNGSPLSLYRAAVREFHICSAAP